jgi:hypothetical protein
MQGLNSAHAGSGAAALWKEHNPVYSDDSQRGGCVYGRRCLQKLKHQLNGGVCARPKWHILGGVSIRAE